MNRIESNALVAALACAACSGAYAQTAPSIYGLLDMSAGRFQDPGNVRLLRAESGRMSSSFLGIRGSDDLGGGLRARFGLETYIRVDAGAAGRSATDPMWGRTAYVGLQGAFGTTLLGRLPTPLWTATLAFNPFADSTGFSPSIRQYFGGAVLGDSRWDNSVLYTSPDPENGRGLSYSLQFNGAENEIGATGMNVGANLRYVTGPFSASLAWQSVRNGATPLPVGFDHQTTYQAGLAYEFARVKLYGQAGSVKTAATTGVKTTLFQLGAVAPIGLGFLIGSYGQAKTESTGIDATRRTVSFGYDYYLSKSTDIYAVLMNERITNLSSGKTLAGGLRVRF